MTAHRARGRWAVRWAKLRAGVWRWATHYEPARARAQVLGLVAALATLGVAVPTGWLDSTAVIITALGYALPVLTGELVRAGVFAPASVAVANDRSGEYTGLAVAGPASRDTLFPPPGPVHEGGPDPATPGG